MSDKWDGVPLNPERDGWHWVESAEGPVPALWARPLWRHCRDFWGQRSPEWMEEQQWRYLGPVLTPAEVEARLVEALKWRDAIDDLRSSRWNDPLRDHETPLRAVQRLIISELTDMALDPEIHKAVKADINQARRDVREEAARRLEELHKNHKYKPETGEGSEHDTGYYRALAEGVAHILALAKGEGDE